MQLDADPDEAFTWKHCHGTFTILIDSGADEKLASSKGGDLKVMNKLVCTSFFIAEKSTVSPMSELQLPFNLNPCDLIAPLEVWLGRTLRISIFRLFAPQLPFCHFTPSE